MELIDYFIAKERSKASSKADLVGAPNGSLANVQDHSQHLRNALEVNGIETISQQTQENNPSKWYLLLSLDKDKLIHILFLNFQA